METITEIAYFSDNVEKMTTFYRALLGSEPVAVSEHMAIFLVGQTKIFIHRVYDPTEGELPPENHTAYAVADVDAAHQVLVRKGLAIEAPPKDYYWGRSVYLRDPDGHLIELIEKSAQ